MCVRMMTELRCQSTERQFLADLIAGAERTAGGRLACWLQPDSRVEPTRCEVHLPAGVPRVGTPLLFAVVPRDQYGDLVRSPALKVEILVQLVETRQNGGKKSLSNLSSIDLMFGGLDPPPVEDISYVCTTKDTTNFHAITIMKAFNNYSFEELRVAAPTGPRAPRVAPEKLSVRPLLDGSFSASWMPRVHGTYAVKCTVDDTLTQEDLSVDVKEALSAGIVGASSSTAPTAQLKDPLHVTRSKKIFKFNCMDSAGLRIRVHPSLQAEEIAVIAPHSNIAITEEVQNNDGTWLRLTPTCAKLYLSGRSSSAVGLTAVAAVPPECWCLQYHQQLDKTLLVPLNEAEMRENVGHLVDSPSHPGPENSDNENDQSEESILFTSVQMQKDIDTSTRSDSADELNMLLKKHLAQPSGSAVDDPDPFVVGEIEEVTDQKLKISTMDSGSNESLSQVESTSCWNKANGNGDGADRSSRSSNEDPAEQLNPEDDEKQVIQQEPTEEEHNLEVQIKEKGQAQDVHTQGSSQDSCGSRLMQAGTQTSPDNFDDKLLQEQLVIGAVKEVKVKAETKARETKARETKRPMIKPAFQQEAISQRRTHKYAMSPTQAECYRAIFAALLWHEGIVHDAMACAAFLKFHPQLPKQGVRVVTRCPASSDETQSRALMRQRHSVEVSNAGNYLHIQPSTLESLTSSAMNANLNRSRGKRIAGPPISEEESQPTDEAEVGTSTGRGTSGGVVKVLPPALRALVALWDKLSGARELGVTADKYMNEEELEKSLCGVDRKVISNPRARKDWRATPTSRTPYSVRCELCNGIGVTPPLAAHMRHTHPGCKSACSKGYDRMGSYVDAGPALMPCGQLAQEYNNGDCLETSHANAAYYLWYMYCESCREKSMKASSFYKSSKNKVVSDPGYDRAGVEDPGTETRDGLDHCAILENALFLLDLPPLACSDSTSSSGYGSNTVGNNTGSPPPPASSLWQPAPPFQSLETLGVAPYKEDEPEEYERRYDTLRRYQPLLLGMGEIYERLLESRGRGMDPRLQQGLEELFNSPHFPRFHRSVSMGQASRELALARVPVHQQRSEDSLTGSGSSLLSQPSAALQKLVGCGKSSRGENVNTCSVSAFQEPQLNLETLLIRPVMTFIRMKRNLKEVRQKMDADVRISTVRQYSLEALNWLLRSVTQPTSLHDVMWWFCVALEQYSRFENTGDKQNQLIDTGGIQAGTQSWVVAGGGRAGRGVRNALHTLLQSIADLMPNLPPTCPSLLQAVRCWALEYAPSDHVFLHRSQVFSVISKILSHTEEDLYEETVAGVLPVDGCTGAVSKDGYIWQCPDVTAWFDITVSSRQGAASALTDGTTETFWESGEEDRNKSKWIQVSCPGGVLEERPHLVCLHIDNTRDTVNKTLLVSFLYSNNTTEMYHIRDVEVDVKSAAWLCYTLPRNAVPPLRVRCELRGPDAAVRVRQLKVLSAPVLRPPQHPANQNASHYKMALERSQPAALILHQSIEAETLRVFRLITSQVFGKLLEWDVTSSEGAESFSREPSVGEDHDETDLREHVVGILFSGSKLTNLQKQVMRHIVQAIGLEAHKACEEWETGLMEDGADSPEPSKHQDNYCFEMLSLLLALSGSTVGREHLALRLELLPDLLSLLHTGSDRVQRQVISLLRRMIGEIPPQKMLVALNNGSESADRRITLMDHLVTYVAKAINVQVKEKGFNGPSLPSHKEAGSPRAPGSVMMGNSITPVPPGFWFMRGQTTKKHAHLVVKLLTDMAEDKLSYQWGVETRTSLGVYTARLASIPDTERRSASCVTASTMWLALSALCVIEESYIELISTGLAMESGAKSRPNEATESRPFCSNHDDGETIAVIDCRSCGPLCHECDRCLHLNRAARTHHRQICKEEESSIRVDIHEGCGRAKLFWLLLLIDRRTLKALAEFRGMGTQVMADETAARPSLPGPPGLAGVCRFCGTHSNTGLLAIGNVCANQDCQEHGRNSCTRMLTCGHLCGGVQGERSCLPCLYGCGGGEAAPALRQDADDMCMICFTDPLAAAPAIQLGCGHVFHQHCCRNVLNNKWLGPRITFSFSQCPICKEDMDHLVLEDLLSPIRALQEEVRRKALMRLEYEGLIASSAIATRYRGDAAHYAMDRYAYYVCFKCKKAYFGGQARCDAESNTQYNPEELVCGGCSDIAGARSCPKHGADFLEYKCRYCCSVAVFFCFGTSHFCNTCHDDFQRVTNIPKHSLPNCPAGPKAKQLEGTSENCPLHMKHPPTGEEFALGCGVCRNSHTF